MATSDDFRTALWACFAAAIAAGGAHVDINAGDLHRQVGGYPRGADPSMPMCCRVMRREMREGDSILDQAPGDAPSLLIRYRLPR